MPTRYDSDDNPRDSKRGDREISLGTGTVLAIFLALALVCSLFFGLGYSMGRRSAPPAPLAANAPYAVNTSSNKPAPGSLTPSRANTAATASRPDSQVLQPAGEGSSRRDSTPERLDRAVGAKPGSQVRSSLKLSQPDPQVDAETPARTPSAPPPGEPTGPQSFVQVAAVSRKEDADLLLAALYRRGYAGAIRQQTQDKLLHIQVGPFPTKKDAEAMRQRLITDGYNPILK